MKARATLGLAVAFATAGSLFQADALIALAQPAPSEISVTRGNPPPPPCGPDENGITKDGRGCSVGPIFAHPFNPNQTPEQYAKEIEWEQSQQKIFCDAHPEQCNRKARILLECRKHPEGCYSRTQTQNLGTITHSDAQWGDPETGKTYLVDPNIGKIIREVGQTVQPPPTKTIP
jgi:hypothetical protein